MGRARNPKGHGQRLREEILEAGMAVLASVSDARQVTMRAVATQAGVTPTSIYLYFADRSALLRAIVDDGFRLVDRHLAAATAPATEPADRLRRLCYAYVRFAEANPGVYRVVFSSAGLGPAELGVADGDDHPGRSSLQSLVDAVNACRPDAPDQAPTALRLWCFLHGLADLRVSKPEIPWPPADTMIDSTLVDLGL